MGLRFPFVLRQDRLHGGGSAAYAGLLAVAESHRSHNDLHGVSGIGAARSQTLRSRQSFAGGIARCMRCWVWSGFPPTTPSVICFAGLAWAKCAEFQRAAGLPVYREPATIRTQVITCGAILGRAGRRLVIHLKTLLAVVGIGARFVNASL